MSSSPSLSDKQQVATDEMVQPAVRARLLGGGKVLVDETASQDSLRTRGFGEREGQEYTLKPYEALYLLQAKRLIIADGKKETDIPFHLLFEYLVKYDRNIMTKFLIYRDLRSRGYVAKEGFGFGDDFRVYERGEYEKKPAKYVVFGISEGASITAKAFAGAIGQIEKMGKEAVVAVIERRGEVIYYKASKMSFSQNKHDTFLIR
jgi:tRNA-intron endonuclease